MTPFSFPCFLFGRPLISNWFPKSPQVGRIYSGGAGIPASPEAWHKSAYSGQREACTQFYDDRERRRGFQQFFGSPFNLFVVHRCCRSQCFIHQCCVYRVGDFSAPFSICLLSFIQIAPAFVCEVQSELVDITKRGVEVGRPKSCGILQI